MSVVQVETATSTIDVDPDIFIVGNNILEIKKAAMLYPGKTQLWEKHPDITEPDFFRAHWVNSREIPVILFNRVKPETGFSNWQISSRCVLSHRHTETGWPRRSNTASWQWVTSIFNDSVERIQPNIFIDSSAMPLLNLANMRLLNQYMPKLVQLAKEKNVPVTKIELSGFIDPEENSKELVITEWVNLNVQAALDYWDKLGVSIESWVGSLPEELKKIAVEEVAIEVRWES